MNDSDIYNIEKELYYFNEVYIRNWMNCNLIIHVNFDILEKAIAQ